MDYVRVDYSRELPYDVATAYAWLTDYDDADAERAGAIISRRTVVERREGEVVLDGVLDTLGQHREGRAVVTLDPPDHWTAQLFDGKGRRSDRYEYRLTALDDGRSQLDVDYSFLAPKLKHKLQLGAAKPLIRRQLDKMWDGFIAAMEKELGVARR